MKTSLILVTMLTSSFAFSASVTRSCQSRLEVLYYHYTDWSQVDTATKRKSKLTDYKSNYGYTRESTSTGLIPSIKKAKERACEDSAWARVDDYTDDDFERRMDSICDSKDGKGYLGILYVRAHAEADDVSFNATFNIGNEFVIWSSSAYMHNRRWDCKKAQLIKVDSGLPISPIIGCSPKGDRDCD